MTKAPAYTSDGEERDNVTPRVITLPAIPYDIDDNMRVTVLNEIGVALGISNPIAITAAYDQDTVTQRLNDLINAANTAGVTPALKTYISTDYNAFTSIINSIVKAVTTIGFPSNTIPPTAGATNLSVSGGGVSSVNTGTWSGTPTSYTYQWYRGNTAIAGATTSSHTLVAADIGYTLVCQVTAVNAAGSATVSSNMIGPVTA